MDQQETWRSINNLWINPTRLTRKLYDPRLRCNFRDNFISIIWPWVRDWCITNKWAENLPRSVWNVIFFSPLYHSLRDLRAERTMVGHAVKREVKSLVVSQNIISVDNWDSKARYSSLLVFAEAFSRGKHIKRCSFTFPPFLSQQSVHSRGTVCKTNPQW